MSKSKSRKTNKPKNMPTKSLKDIVADYSAYIESSGKSKNTVAAYTADVEKYVKFLATKSILDIRNEDITDYIEHLTNEGKSLRTVNRATASIKGFYKYLKEVNILKETLEINIEQENPKQELTRILNHREVRILINSIDKSCIRGTRDAAMIELMYATGMKVTEIINLNIEDIDIMGRNVRCKDRIIPVSKGVCTAVNTYLIERHSITTPSTSSAFVNLNGGKISRQGVHRIIATRAYEAKLEGNINATTLRHSFAVGKLQEGLSVQELRELLGTGGYTKTYSEYINNMNGLRA